MSDKVDDKAKATPKAFSGGCHCGKVRFDVTLALDGAVACNCSICEKKSPLLAFTSVENFVLRSGEAELRDYQFNKKQIHHLFCSVCGVESFAGGVGPDGKEMRAINLRCLDGVDVASLPVHHFDGKNM